MKFFKNNFKIVVIAILGILFQFFIVGSMISIGNKEKANIDRMERQNVTDSYYYEPDYDLELDSIESSKKSKYNRNSEEIEDEKQEIKENIEEDTGQIKTGKVPVDLEFSSSPKIKQENTKPTKVKVNTKESTTTSKEREMSNKKNKNEELKQEIEKTKKKAIGTWKSVNESDGKFESFYIEFFEDGSYKKYNESRNIVYTGKYTFTSPSKIKMNYETIKLSNIDGVKEENETFTVDINFKDDKSFSVSDIKRFNFSDYEKIK